MPKQESVKELYNKIASTYAKNRSRTVHGLTEIPKMIELMSNVKGKSVLDLGCGIGEHAKAYLDQGARVTGVDVSEKMLAIAKKTCRGKGKFILGDFEKIDFKAKEFDLISASYCIHYSNKINYLFSRFAKWLKDGGRVVFSIYHPVKYFIKVKDFDFSKSQKVYFRTKSYGVDLFNYYHPLEKYFDAIKKNGFELEKFTETTVPKSIKGLPSARYRIPTAIVIKIRKSA